jgi:hypothetical protein
VRCLSPLEAIAALRVALSKPLNGAANTKDDQLY